MNTASKMPAASINQNLASFCITQIWLRLLWVKRDFMTAKVKLFYLIKKWEVYERLKCIGSCIGLPTIGCWNTFKMSFWLNLDNSQIHLITKISKFFRNETGVPMQMSFSQKKTETHGTFNSTKVRNS